MAQLEYRLLDEENGFPALYHYHSITKEEIIMRFLCDYFVKDGAVYEKTSNAIEPPLYVIYVKPSPDEVPLPTKCPSAVGMGIIVMEVREYRDGSEDYSLLQSMEFSTLTDIALMGQCNYILLEGVEWEQTSLEVDEDRQTYVLYVKRAN